MSEDGAVTAPEIASPHNTKKLSIGALIIAPVVRASRIKVHRLLIFLIQLALMNFVVFSMYNRRVGMILGTLSVFLVFPLSCLISRLVGANLALSILIGGFITAMLVGGLSYLLAIWAAPLGIVYGAFYGASLTCYFSAEDENINLFWASITTVLLIVSVVILGCSSYNIANCLELIKDYIGNSLLGAVMTITLGLCLSPIIISALDSMESYVDKFIDLLRGEK